MLLTDQHPHNKSIMISVLGLPNVGKSSLINYLMGLDLSVVTNKPQTTRNRFHCVLTIDHTEVILVDTPGVHRSNVEFNKRLNEQAREGIDGADLNLLLIDLSRPVLKQVQEFHDVMDKELGPTWVVFTKADKIEGAENLPLEEIVQQAKELVPAIERHYFVSSKEGTNMEVLTGAICDHARPGPHLYLDGSVSNKNERFFVSEYVREQAFLLLKDEIPYEVAVVIDEFKDIPKEDKNGEKVRMSHISATILVNRPSQRAIVVGKKGEMIKNIGMRSRKKIEAMMGCQVHLNLHVKVTPKWFKNNYVLEELGLPRAADSNRVWKSRG